MKKILVAALILGGCLPTVADDVGLDCTYAYVSFHAEPSYVSTWFYYLPSQGYKKDAAWGSCGGPISCDMYETFRVLDPGARILGHKVQGGQHTSYGCF